MNIENDPDARNSNHQNNTNQNGAEDTFEPEVINESKLTSGKTLNEAVNEALIDHYFERLRQELDFKMTQELEAGFYCLLCSSDKLVLILKVFSNSELAIVTTDKLDDHYQYFITCIQSIFKHNEQIKEIDDYPQMLSLMEEFPDAISNNTLKYTKWGKVLEAACKLQAKASKLANRYCATTYTPITGDTFTNKLIEARKYINEHWEIRKLNSDKELVGKIGSTATLNDDINKSLTVASQNTPISTKKKEEYSVEIPEKIKTEQVVSDDQKFWINKEGIEIYIRSESEKYKLKSVTALSQYDLFMDFLLSNERQVKNGEVQIAKEDWENFYQKEKKSTPGKLMPDILYDLKFIGKLKKLFFPKCSKAKVVMRKYISGTELKNSGFDIASFNGSVKTKKPKLPDKTHSDPV